MQFIVNKTKGRISKQVFQENKASQIFRKTNISYHVCVSGGKKCSFFGKFGVLCFLETAVLRFALLSYYRRLHVTRQSNICDGALILQTSSIMDVQVDCQCASEASTSIVNIIDTHQYSEHYLWRGSNWRSSIKRCS